MKQFRTIQPKLKCGTATHSYGAVEPITIKEPYKPDVKEFDDTDEFTRYFRSHEEQFKEVSTDPEKPSRFLTANKLNRTYKIPGYRIRIIRKGTDNEELTLVKDYHGKSIDLTEESENNSVNETTERIDRLEELIQSLVDRVNNIESFLLQLKR